MCVQCIQCVQCVQLQCVQCVQCVQCSVWQDRFRSCNVCTVWCVVPLPSYH